MDEAQRPVTHEEPRRDFGAGPLGWAYVAAMAIPVLGFLLFGLVGVVVGLLLAVGVFFVLRAAS
jgi:hypothetical protein